jgi:serine/threonine-protein kinase
MAPEQARAQPPDARDDIYSFGCLMYQVLCGDVPFTAPSIQKVLLMHMQQPVEPPRARRPDAEIPPAAEEIVMRCLEKTRERRFQSMAEVASAISGVAVPRKMTAALAPTSSPGVHAPAGGSTPAPRVIFEVPESRSRRRLRVGLALLVVALFGTAAWLHHTTPPAGRLQVITDPPDATIYVDGRKMADRSPLQLDASAGRYRVSAHHEGCDDVSTVVDLASGVFVRVPLKLPVGESTRLELESDPPGALLWLDGEPLADGERQARTPFSAGRVQPGKHAVEMEGVPGHGPWHGRIQVTLGSSVSIRGTLPHLEPETDLPPPPLPPPPAHHHHVVPVGTAVPAKPDTRTAADHAPGTTFLDFKTGEVKQH